MTTEELAEAYADSIDRRGCAFWQGMYRGYIAGHEYAAQELAEYKTRLKKTLAEFPEILYERPDILELIDNLT